MVVTRGEIPQGILAESEDGNTSFNYVVKNSFQIPFSDSNLSLRRELKTFVCSCLIKQIVSEVS